MGVFTMQIKRKPPMQNEKKCRPRPRTTQQLLAAVTATLCTQSFAAADVTIKLADANSATVTSSNSAITISLSDAALYEAPGLLAAKPEVRREGGRTLLTFAVGTSESASVGYADGGKTIRLMITGGIAALKPAKNTEQAKEKTLEEKLKALQKLITDGQEDLGVPSSPALSLLGVDPSKAINPRSPKDLAAALVQGRGADGKIKAGVALDVSFAQLLEVSPMQLKGTARGTEAIGTEEKREQPKVPLSSTARAHYETLTKNRKSDGFGPSFLSSSFVRTEAVDDKHGGGKDGDTSHRFANRLKLSLATTQDEKGEGKSAADISFGAHYVFFDRGDPLTSNCDGANQRKPEVQEAVKALVKDKLNEDRTKDFTPGDLRALLTNRYKKGSDLSTADLLPVIAACSLTPAERLKASAAMFGIAHAYKLVDGGWASKQSGAKGLWATYVSPGLEIANISTVQAIFHARATRNQPVVDPNDSKKTVVQDSNLYSLRFRAAGPRGAGSLEFSRSKNTVDGKPETVNRRALGLEWKLADGI
jgi:hypothetical protein